MADTDLWITFVKTGSVEDYLSYKGVSKEDREEAGEKAFESVNCSYGNDIVRSTNR